MGISWKIHENENLVSVSLFGQSSLLETVDSFRALDADPKFDSSMRRLYICADNLEDGPGLDSTRGAFTDVLAHQVVKMFDHPAPVAFVYKKGNAVAADRFTVTARVCDEIYMKDGLGPMERAAFSDLAPALKWLDLDPDFKP